MACDVNVPQSQRHLNTVTILCTAYSLRIKKHLRALGTDPVLDLTLIQNASKVVFLID